MNRIQALLFTALSLLCTFVTTSAQTGGAYIDPHIQGGYEIDAKGIRHTAPHPPDQVSGAGRDCIKMVAPSYPYDERIQRHTGNGYFRVILDLKSGTVKMITVAKSTGYPALDNAAIVALRDWRWKPNRWKELEIPVFFRLDKTPTPLPAGAVEIPSR